MIYKGQDTVHSRDRTGHVGTRYIETEDKLFVD